MIINSARIKWLDSGFPYSDDYNDRYFADENPIEESKHVFLHGNDLGSRWKSLQEDLFIIAEIGFGFGLNFILSYELWQLSAGPHKRLHYVAFEKHPPTREQMYKFYSNFPMLSEPSKSLCEKIPSRSSGCHRIQFNDTITLDLHYGDAQHAIKGIYCEEKAIDTWFVDGFSPKLNPVIWNAAICKQIAQHSGIKTTLSSYSAAGTFRRELEINGLTTKKAPGYGLKRHMTTAKYPATERHDSNSRQNKGGRKTSIGIIGAGLAGCATAYSLAKRGFKVEIFDSDTKIANHASGIPFLALRPRLFQLESPIAQYFLHSFLFSTTQFTHLSKSTDIGWNETGVMQLNHALNKRKPIELKKISSIYSDDVLRPFSTEESKALAGVQLSKAGILFPHGGMIKPNDLCNFYINSPSININLNVPIKEIRYINNQWNLYSGKPNPLTKVDKLVLANSSRLSELMQTKYLPLSQSSGTVTWFSATTSSRSLKSIVCGKRTVFPLHKAESENHLVAASYSNETDILSASKAAQENYEGAIQNFDFAEILANTNRSNKSGMRCSTPDRIPYIGKIPDYEAIRKKLAYSHKNARKSSHLTDDCYWPELYINAAHGSNGAATCPFSAEILASMINEEPLPIDKEILASINPSRIVIRDLKKQKG